MSLNGIAITGRRIESLAGFLDPHSPYNPAVVCFYKIQ